MQFFGIWYIIKGFSSIEVVDNIYFFSVHGQWVVKALLLHCPNVWLVPRSQRISLLCVRCSFNPFAPAASPALCPGSDSRSFVCPQPAPDVFAPPRHTASARSAVSLFSEPSLSALEWFRLHFTCECCCFLNYGDRNRVEAAAESQFQPSQSRSCSLRAKPSFRLRFCYSWTAQWC